MVPKKRILVVEDYPYTRELYIDVLREAGFEATGASDGQEALTAVTHTTYDLILLDIMMPIINGVTFLKHLKKMGLMRTPVVVLLTNLAHENVIKEAMELGAHSFFIKSELNPKELLDHITKILV